MRTLFTSAAILFCAIIFVGCSIISAKFIPSGEIHQSYASTNNLYIYYDKNEVPFKYKEIGRVFLKNNHQAGFDPAEQISKIKRKAQESGADAVIITQETRRESTFYIGNYSSAGSSGDVYQYSGIAIVKA